MFGQVRRSRYRIVETVMSKAIAGGITLNLLAGIIVTVVTICGTAVWMADQHDQQAAAATRTMIEGGADLEGVDMSDLGVEKQTALGQVAGPEHELAVGAGYLDEGLELDALGGAGVLRTIGVAHPAIIPPGGDRRESCNGGWLHRPRGPAGWVTRGCGRAIGPGR